MRINCICPGDVETPLVQDYFNKDPDPERLRQQVSSHYALRRIAAPAEIAQAAAFLASDASSFMTASTLVVDGGTYFEMLLACWLVRSLGDQSEKETNYGQCSPQGICSYLIRSPA